MLRRAGAKIKRPSDRQRPEAHKASLKLPLQAEGLMAFARRVDTIIRSPSSFVYFDTSFLMWLIKISLESRSEFFEWLEEAANARVAVPAWSLHELYRHHTEDRVSTDLDEQLKKLTGVIGEAFPTMWTLFDERLQGAASVKQQREQARDALRAVKTLTDRAASWKAHYSRNASEVIAFANEHAMDGGTLFEQFSAIDTLADARFTGRVPPGFQDKRKREAAAEDDDGNSVEIGSNRWGDLVFWREILEHARNRRIKHVVILSKDVKNDWRMAGKLPITEGETAEGAGVQPPHPMLSFEAAQTANVEEVVLLDQGRLAQVMKLGPLGVSGFCAVAQPPSLPPPKTENELRDEAIERQALTAAAIQEGAARAANVRFLDPDGLNASDGILRRALMESRANASPSAAVLEFEAAAGQVAEPSEMVDLITCESAGALGGAGLLSIARRVAVRAMTDTQAAIAADELAARLETFPQATATFLYMGLLAGSYLDGGNKMMREPNRVVAQKLLLLGDQPLAKLPTHQIERIAASAAQRPLFVPSDATPIVVEIKVDTELDRHNSLRSIWVLGQELLIDVQAIPDLKLDQRFRDVRLTPELLLDHIAELYALPRKQLASTGFLAEEGYTFDGYSGFRAPCDVWRDTSEENT